MFQTCADAEYSSVPSPSAACATLVPIYLHILSCFHVPTSFSSGSSVFCAAPRDTSSLACTCAFLWPIGDWSLSLALLRGVALACDSDMALFVGC